MCLHIMNTNLHVAVEMLEIYLCIDLSKRGDLLHCYGSHIA